MIADQCFPRDELYAFLLRNDRAFTHPLSESLARLDMTLADYSDKLASISTITYEQAPDGSIMGIVAGYTANLPPDGGSYITQVATDYGFRGRGVCGRLLEEYIRYCRTKPVRFIWLMTGTRNYTAQRVYEKAGFYRLISHKPDMVKYVYNMEQE